MPRRSSPELTDKQAQVYVFIKSMVAAHGYPPTCKEIAEKFQYKSPNAVSDHLRYMEKKGFIKRSGSRSRAIEILK